MKEITLEIKDLFDFVSQKFGVNFVENEFVDLEKLNLDIEIPNADGEFVKLNGLITKKDDIYETAFDNGKVLKSAAEHLISVEPFHKPEECLTRLTKDWEAGDDIPYLNTKCVSNKKIADNETVYGLSVVDEKHLYKDADGMIHHNTYLVREVAKKYIGSSGKKLFYSSGAMSPSMSSVVPFFFFHRNGEVIILDDNDRIIMKNCDQNTQNFMKAVLDPSALNKPVSVPTTMMKQFQQQLDQISGMNESAGRKPLHIEIDTEALREQRFVMKVDGEIAMNDYLTEAEARELSNMFTAGKRLHERSDEDIDDFFSEDGEGSSADDDLVDNRVKMEPSFIFDSSVIFISNLKLAEISPAVADRCESCEVTLSLSQFMTRLESILGGLCQGAKYSSRPQYIRDWAKENIYVMLQGLVEAYHTGAVLFGSKVNINRKFTFRMFEEFANFWARKATVVAENGGFNLEDDGDRHKVGQQIEKFVLRKMLQYLAQKQAKD